MGEISRHTALWLSDRKAVAFSVEVDGREVPCIITLSVLTKGSGGEIKRGSDAMRAYHALKLRFLPPLVQRIRAGAVAGNGDVEVIEADLDPA